MMQITGLLLMLVLLAVVLYGLYWVVRKAVAHGIRDARANRDAERASSSQRVD